MDDASQCDLRALLPPLERRRKSNRNMLVDLKVERVDIVPAGAQGRVFALRKEHEEKTMTVNIPALMEIKLEKAAELEAILKSIPDEGARALLEGILKMLQAGADAIPVETLSKAFEVMGVKVPAEKAVAVEKAAVEEEDPEIARIRKEYEEKSERLEKALNDEVRLRKSRDFGDRITKEFGSILPVAAIPALFAASEGEPVAKADYANLHQALRGMAELIRDSVIAKQHIGYTSVNDGVSDKISARVAELKKADPKMSDTAARVKAFAEDPEAYEAFRATWRKPD